MTNFDAYVLECLKEPDFKKAFESKQPLFRIVKNLIDARNEAGLTQKELAAKCGVHKSEISKLECGNANPTLKMLLRIAKAMNADLELKFVPKAESAEQVL